ncbi:hypothetical protein L7F22_008422 [Adiantum nelumboides]|nr:hypothetical protein [Adiantum nelumboides]
MEVRIPIKEVLLVARPKGLPKESDLQVAESELVYTRPLSPGSVVLKVLWLSIDPYLRALMREDSGPLRILPVFELGKPIFAWSLSKVIDSGNPEYKEGDFTFTLTNVATYVEVSSVAQVLHKINPNRPRISLTHYLGVLGYSGFASWLGINVVTQLKHGEAIFISTASGAVGLLVGELAKLKGCRVVGSAGSDKKVELLKEVYRFDDAFNYKKEENLELALRRCFPSGFDVYFENVGGKMLEAALEVINPNGRIVACGMISEYFKEADKFDGGVRNLFNMVGKGLKMVGFVMTSYFDKWDAFQEEVSTLLEEGKIRYETHVLGRGLEEFGKALIGLLCGENIGKAVVHVDDE